MDDKTYRQFCAALSSDVKTRLEHIRSYVHTNRASVMVGAGFSKNAETSDSAGMKDWNELAKVFYKKLYCEEPTDADLVFESPMKLASMIEATFGKKVLDELIEDTLSPKDTMPGMLHEMLPIIITWWKTGNRCCTVRRRESSNYMEAFATPIPTSSQMRTTAPIRSVTLRW